jgi:hypothetical protein
MTYKKDILDQLTSLTTDDKVKLRASMVVRPITLDPDERELVDLVADNLKLWLDPKMPDAYPDDATRTRAKNQHRVHQTYVQLLLAGQPVSAACLLETLYIMEDPLMRGHQDAGRRTPKGWREKWRRVYCSLDTKLAGDGQVQMEVAK